MNRSRPAYVERKRELEQQRREALRTHSKECICGYCLTPAKTAELVKAALARNPSAGEEVPF